MVDATWLRWEAWRDAQARADKDNAEDCIPFEVCECPPRGSESE